jgi:hypothetical protein
MAAESAVVASNCTKATLVVKKNDFIDEMECSGWMDE